MCARGRVTLCEAKKIIHILYVPFPDGPLCIVGALRFWHSQARKQRGLDGHCVFWRDRRFRYGVKAVRCNRRMPVVADSVVGYVGCRFGCRAESGW